MKHLNLQQPAAVHDPERLARLVRHLAARLGDFGPGGPEVISADQTTGRVTARFPGHETEAVCAGLARMGFETGLEDGALVLQLRDDVAFEALDRLWGSLFELL